jgi:hypothetical protein
MTGDGIESITGSPSITVFVKVLRKLPNVLAPADSGYFRR